MALYSADPVKHDLVVIRLEEVLGPVVGGEPEHVLLLGVVVGDVGDTGLDGDWLFLTD